MQTGKWGFVHLPVVVSVPGEGLIAASFEERREPAVGSKLAVEQSLGAAGLRVIHLRPGAAAIEGHHRVVKVTGVRQARFLA